jgi:hypothetical protein
LRDPGVKVGDDMTLHVDLGGNLCVSRKNRRLRGAALTDVRGNDLAKHPDAVDNREPGNEHNEHETPISRPSRAPSRAWRSPSRTPCRSRTAGSPETAPPCRAR